MNIVMHCLGLPFNGETPYTQSLGGSETACWAMAREMVKLGHQVTVFTLGEPGEFEGVVYANAGPITDTEPLGAEFHHYATNAPIDALVIQRHPAAFNLRYNSKLNFQWLHDIASKEHAPYVGGSLWQVDGIFTVSEYHRRQVIKAYDLPEDAVIATQNGLNLDWFEEPSGERHPHTLLYSSRPERGLEHLVKPGGIMDRLKEARPDIDFTLGICHYVDPPQAQGWRGTIRVSMALWRPVVTAAC